MCNTNIKTNSDMSQGFNLNGYDKYIVSFSGGKDSTALLLFLLENGVPKDRIELWHQEMTGAGAVFLTGR